MFCARCQKESTHKLDVASNGEVVITCLTILSEKTEEQPEVRCERFIKFPNSVDAAKLKEYIAAHKTANEGQVSVQSIEDKKAELLKAFSADDKEPVG